MRILVGLVPDFSGMAHVERRDARLGPPSLGAILEEPAFYPYLSARENLEFLAAIGELDPERVDLALEVTSLTGVEAKKAGTLSHGTRQRLGLAAALLAEPRVLVLDEPMTGLDPKAQLAMRQVLGDQVKSGKALLISTHNLREVEALSDRLVFLRKGRVVASGSTQDLQQAAAILIRIRDPQSAHQVLKASGYSVRDTSDEGTLAVDGLEGQATEDLIRTLAAEGLFPTEVRVHRASLEEVYLDLMAGGDDDS